MGAWSDADAAVKAGGVKCHCGRPLGHAGKHFGRNATQRIDAAPPAKPLCARLHVLLEREVQASHATIVQLKTDIRQRQAKLLEVEARLGALIKLLDTYRQLALPAPAEPDPSAEISPPALVAKPNPIKPKNEPWVASQAQDTDDDDSYEPIEADFNKIAAWADVRKLPFRTWDDLPAINAHREKYELPIFKRKLTNGYRIGAR